MLSMLYFVSSFYGTPFRLPLRRQNENRRGLHTCRIAKTTKPTDRRPKHTGPSGTTQRPPGGSQAKQRYKESSYLWASKMCVVACRKSTKSTSNGQPRGVVACSEKSNTFGQARYASPLARPARRVPAIAKRRHKKSSYRCTSKMCIVACSEKSVSRRR